MTCAKRYKIERKVAEHRRKEKKKAKNNPHKSKLRKDPGIPSLWPFKGQLLSKIEEQKRKVEEEKKRQKEDRHKQFDKNRNLNFSSLAKDASERSEAFEQNASSEDEEGLSKVVDAAAVGHKDNSRKAYYKEFRKVIEAADVILEILDARDPLGCRTKQVEKMINSSGSSKRIILILNKIDLIPRENVMQWLSYLRREYPTVAFKSSTQIQRKNLGHAAGSIVTASNNILNGNECLGADMLIKLLKNYSRNCNIKTSITVGIIGFPNVGKSSVINSLKRSRVCGVGATPGLTKSAQEIHLDKNIKLLDSPGIVFSRDQFDDNCIGILLRNCVKVELLSDPIKPVEVIVSRCDPKQLMSRYNVPMFRDAREFLILLARQRGKLGRGGVPCLESAARTILHDWNSGKIPYYTTPPATPKNNSIIDSTIVATWGKEFDLEGVCNDAEEKVLLEGVKSKGEFGGGAIVMSGEEPPEIEMEMFDGDESDESQSYMDEDVPEAVAIKSIEGSSGPIISQFKSSTKGEKSKEKQNLFTALELEINPQIAKDRKKDIKKRKKALKKIQKRVTFEDTVDDMEGYRASAPVTGEHDDEEDL
ncbi:14563_t:CDS:2 [Acaulospora morrowiae]|uniref:14563_t:CDS:1 n=1 Tax=Acaulospora morrowiae TaxID=94023 RepID=A0A9N8ZS97_9GLOM|nr:14563_t:CDS:2 [Acaulospora morrowiae]